MKKSICRILIFSICLSTLAGCGSKKDVKQNTATRESSADSSNIADSKIDINKKLLSDPSKQDLPENKKKYTIMLYMIGSNLESSPLEQGGGAASQDLKEIMFAMPDPDQVNILVYTGGAKQWWTDGIPNDKNAVFQYWGTDGYKIISTTDTNYNTTDAQCLYDFVRFSYENYPADNYGLILWDHGSGSVLGYGYDEFYSDGRLILAEMQKAMEASPFGPDNRLQFVGFDACMMAGLEVAYSWADYADYLIASTDREPGSGWDYRFMSKLNETDDGLEIGKACVDSYDSYYALINEWIEEDAETPEMALKYRQLSTLSLIDLRAVDPFMKEFDALMKSLTEDMDEVYPELGNIRANTKRYGSSDNLELDMIDLYDFLNNLPDKYRNSISRELMDKLVVYSKANIDNSNGVSIYMPYYWKDLYFGDLYNNYYHEYNISDAYRGYLDSFGKKRFGEQTEPSSNLELINSAINEVWFTINQNLLNDISSLTCNVLYSPNGDNNYIPIIKDMLLKIDEFGNTFKPEQIPALVAESLPIPIGARQLSEDNDKISVAVGNLCLVGKDGVRVPVYVRAEIDTQTGEFKVNDILRKTEDFTPAGKGIALTDGWDTIETEIKSVVPTYSKKNVLLPVSEWENGKSSWSAGIPVKDISEKGVLFNTIPVENLPGNVAAQVILEDVYGNVTVSDLIIIK